MPLFWRSWTVVGNGSNIGDHFHIEISFGTKETKCGIASYTRTLEENSEFFDPVLFGFLESFFDSSSGGIRSGLSGTFEAHASGASPSENVSFVVGDGNESVVEC